MSDDPAYQSLLKKAKSVLEKNWIQPEGSPGFTKPASFLYPFQWNWDTAFIAYGYSHYNTRRAIEDYRSLFAGQWSSGMLPHIIFHGGESTYFPGPSVWDSSNATEHSPGAIQTSGITQPPLHALAIWHIYKPLKERDPKAARAFLEEFYPKLYALHKYLLTERDPERWGIVTIYHPWESGLDNSPRWDEALNRVESMDMSGFERWDTKFINKKNRPSTEEYGRYMQLLTILKEHSYDDRKLYKSFPFKVKDKLFSTILYLANDRLRRIGDALGESTVEISEWMKRYEKHLFSKLWNEEDGLFYDYDLVSDQQIKIHSAAALLPMITGLLPPQTLNRLIAELDTANLCGDGTCAVGLVPSLGTEHALFNEELYWRGPVWININWLLWKGFGWCNLPDRANAIRTSMLDLMAKEGFWEYYSPKTGKGIGAQNFSWSAALAIDLIHEDTM